MLFREVIGQEPVKDQLVQMIRQNRLSHALLFLGSEGSGALSLALALSQYIALFPQTGTIKNRAAATLFGNEGSKDNTEAALPENAAEADNLMQQDPGFSKVAGLVHPDIHFSYPVIPRRSGDRPVSADYITEWREFIGLNPYGNVYDWLQFIGADNKQGNITAHECNDIIRKLNLKSFESRYKILILWMPEYLGNEGNKLLKLIEEPPANTLFILVGENESLILPTIVSRTQLVRVPALKNTDVESALINRAGVAAEQARQIAAVAEGNYREALLLIQHAEEDWQSLLRDWLNAALKTGPVAQVKWVDEISRLGREKQKQFLRYFNHLLEQAIKLNINGVEHLNLPENEMDFAERLNKLSTLSQQQAILEELDKAVYYIERNANAKMLFQALTIRIYHIIAHNSLILMN